MSHGPCDMEVVTPSSLRSPLKTTFAERNETNLINKHVCIPKTKLNPNRKLQVINCELNVTE